MKALVLIPVLLLAACGEPPADPVAESRDAGREETHNIRNTEAIGYAGDAIADKVDGALDAHENRKRRLDEEEDSPY